MRGELVHVEILVEDRSGKIVLDAIVGKILESIGPNHSYRIFSYRGLGRIPPNLGALPDPRKRLLLNKLPMLLRGYGKNQQHHSAAVVVVVDLDNKNCAAFKQEMLNLVETCDPKPTTHFRIAIEEIEAWLLGDRDAVKAAYPHAREAVLNGYEQDSICGTWERLADAIYPGGSQRLKRVGYPEVGRIKCKWAEEIATHLNPEVNLSKSFQVFRDGIKNLAGTGI